MRFRYWQRCLVESQPFVFQNASPSKRAKASHPDTTNAPTRPSSKSKGKQKKSLSLVLEMPLDVLFEVCSLHPNRLHRLPSHRYSVISSQGIWSTWPEHPRFSEKISCPGVQRQYGELCVKERVRLNVLTGWASLPGRLCSLNMFVR